MQCIEAVPREAPVAGLFERHVVLTYEIQAPRTQHSAAVDFPAPPGPTKRTPSPRQLAIPAWII